MKRVWALVAILALLLGACGEDDDSGTLISRNVVEQVPQAQPLVGRQRVSLLRAIEGDRADRAAFFEQECLTHTGGASYPSRMSGTNLARRASSEPRHRKDWGIACGHDSSQHSLWER